jgi:hypothetical protein
MADSSKWSPSAGSHPGKFSSALLNCLCLFLFAGILTAQDGERVSMKIDVVAWGDEIGGLSFKSGKKEGRITARAFTYSEPIDYSGPRLLSIHQAGDGKVEETPVTSTPEDKEHQSIPLPIEEIEKVDNTPVPDLLAKRREEDPTLVSLVPLPRNCRRATVLLAPAAAGTYRGYVINDDPNTLPLGCLRAHNLSQFTIAMQFSGGQKKEMKPGESLVVRVPKGHTVYHLAYLDGEDWLVQGNNIVPVRADEQAQLIVLKSDNQHFLSSDGAAGGFLQLVTLRRQKEPSS